MFKIRPQSFVILLILSGMFLFKVHSRLDEQIEFGEHLHEYLNLTAARNRNTDGTEVVDLNCTVDPRYLERISYLNDFYFSRRTKNDEHALKITSFNSDRNVVVFYQNTKSEWKKLQFMRDHHGINGKIVVVNETYESATMTLRIPIYPCIEHSSLHCSLMADVKIHPYKEETQIEKIESYLQFIGTSCPSDQGNVNSKILIGILLGVGVIGVISFFIICFWRIRLPTQQRSDERESENKGISKDKDNTTYDSISNVAASQPCVQPLSSPTTKLSGNLSKTNMPIASASSSSSSLFKPKSRKSFQDIIASKQTLGRAKMSSSSSVSDYGQSLTTNMRGHVPSSQQETPYQSAKNVSLSAPVSAQRSMPQTMTESRQKMYDLSG